MKVFILFVIVSLADLIFTCIGINKGIIEEYNFFINLLNKHSIFNIYQSIIASKILTIIIAYWLIKDSYIRIQKQNRLTFKFLAKEKFPKRLLLVLTIITIFLIVIPLYLTKS